MKRFGLFSAVAVVCASLHMAPANAAPTCTTVTPALDQQVTCSYNAGGTTDITVPAGAAYMAVVLQGAGGGGGGATTLATGASGGAGAQVSATLSISGISTVRAVVGGGGSGGIGVGSSIYNGGMGGGFTALYEGASSAAVDVLAVGGGGGGGGGGIGGVSTKTGGAGAANNTPAGGDGVSPGFGAPGDGSGGTGSDGANGATWAAGGAGGTGTDVNSGNGGAGYGGGEEGESGGGGSVNGGGGAGGSYVRPALLVGSAVYSPTGGAGGSGGSGTTGANGANGTIAITFSAEPITPLATSSTAASFVDFTYVLPDGRECTSISPMRVQVGTTVELPGVDALCRTMPGSSVAGWTIPVPAGFTGAGSSSLPFNPGHKVRVIESQQFTVVPFDPVITVEYDANIAADDSCTPANMAFTNDDGRVGYSWVPRSDLSVARTWSAAPCSPAGYELVGWNTAGDGSGERVRLGDPLPDSWAVAAINNRRLFAVWRAI